MQMPKKEARGELEEGTHSTSKGTDDDSNELQCEEKNCNRDRTDCEE